MKSQVVYLNVSGSMMYKRMNLRALGGASLYSISVAWVSLIRLTPKRGLSFATWLCSELLASFDFCCQRV